MNLATEVKPWVKPLAQTGLIAKGIVYVLLGVLGFMAAFEIGSKGNDEATQTGALKAIKEFPAGTLLLILLAAGLLCYSVWRGIQGFYNTDGKDKKLVKRVRYIFSGLAYLGLAYTAIRVVLSNNPGKSDKNQSMATDLLSKPFGQILVGLLALTLAAVGIYQIYYGLSEKYKKHVQELSLHSTHAAILLRSGKIGYISRGIVWLVISYLFMQAAVHSAGSEAGNTGKAFRFIEGSPYGSYLLGALGLGLIAYGTFNFVRARYDHF